MRSYVTITRLVLPSVHYVCFLAGCASLSFDGKETFAEWYIGPAGFMGMFGQPKEGSECSFTAGVVTSSPITDSRGHAFGHFRLPELLWQPAGGLDYPARLVCATEEVVKTIDTVTYGTGDERIAESPRSTSIIRTTNYGRLREANSGEIDRHVDFDVADAGLLDAMIPYRLLRSSGTAGEKARGLAYWPLIVLGNAVTAAIEGTAYVCHDVVKTLMIPYAVVHYQ